MKVVNLFLKNMKKYEVKLNRKKLIFHLGHSMGFYSEFNNMVLAILYCRIHDIKFMLYSQDAVFRENRGWTDYFLPFCREFFLRPIHFINGRTTNPKLGIKTHFYNIVFKLFIHDVYLTQELWSNFRELDRTFTTVNIDGIEFTDLRKACKLLIEKIYVFNPRTRQEVDILKSTVDICGEYIAIHIRGGDKKIESEIIAIDKYMEKVAQISSIKQIFVSTDDYTFFELLCAKYKDYHFYTISESTSRGYLQRDFIMFDGSKKRKELINMFASMELLLNAKHTICTFSSNIGMFIGMVKEENVYSVDLPNWQIW